MKHVIATAVAALLSSPACAYTPEQDKIVSQLQGAIWAANNCRDLRINTMEMLQQLGDAHLLANKSTFDEIKKIDPEIDKVFRGMGKEVCQLLWYQYGSNSSIPTKGKLLFMSK